jgi:hypothetical protein
MIIFGDFHQITANQWQGKFVCNEILSWKISIPSINYQFFAIFWQKYFWNHGIGPRKSFLGPNIIFS